MTNPNDAVRMLREALLDAKFALYGNGPGNPKMEAALSATANVQAEEVPAHPAQGDAELIQLLKDCRYAASIVGNREDCLSAYDLELPYSLPPRIDAYLQSPASVDAQRDAARWQAIESACSDREILEMVEAVTALMAFQCQVPLSQIKESSPAQNLDAAIAAQTALKDSK